MIILRKRIQELPWTKENIERFKEKNNMLRHAKCTPDVSGIFFVESGKLIGYIAWEGSMIVALEVMPEFQGQGWGKELLGRAIEEGATELTVDPKNIKALGLYRSQGFKEIGQAGKLIHMKLRGDKEYGRT